MESPLPLMLLLLGVSAAGGESTQVTPSRVEPTGEHPTIAGGHVTDATAGATSGVPDVISLQSTSSIVEVTSGPGTTSSISTTGTAPPTDTSHPPHATTVFLSPLDTTIYSSGPSSTMSPITTPMTTPIATTTPTVTTTNAPTATTTPSATATATTATTSSRQTGSLSTRVHATVRQTSAVPSTAGRAEDRTQPHPSTSAHWSPASQLNVGDENISKAPLDTLVVSLVSAFVISATIVFLLIFVKFRHRNEQPEFRRLQDLPMNSF
ncbi:cell wall integrity and stress response component 4-like isoform X2 [Denticeps clupeoides]|uniref:cell wall integrity and stress response component 4-like isoform X2 n=1 Tax=Denticeps clupeoides TaxID=299321 RepID=UPI0010A3658C|nr:cell wall integrity and stress response component 4-like isoform X2 [Denticeps clupeoides]